MEHQKKHRTLSDLAGLAELAEFSNLGQHPGTQTGIPVSQKPTHDGKGKTVHLSLDTHGRKGKCVTMVIGLQHNPSTMEDIARVLKQFCGTGGTVKEGKIELQGDQRTRAGEKLKEMKYRVI